MTMKTKVTSLWKIAIGGLFLAVLFSLIAAVSVNTTPAFAAGPAWGPKWTSDDELVLPEGYHEWVFLGSPLTPHALNGETAPFPEYHNVYVQPEAFRAYRKTGEFPEGTILLKELQLTTDRAFPDGSSLEVSGRGYFPAERNGIDISGKDTTRFAESNGWGFFNFGHNPPPYLETAAEQPIDACAGCHIANADDMVFKKFYSPILNAD